MKIKNKTYRNPLYKGWDFKDLTTFRDKLQDSWNDNYSEDINFPDSIKGMHLELKIDEVNDEIKTRLS